MPAFTRTLTLVAAGLLAAFAVAGPAAAGGAYSGTGPNGGSATGTWDAGSGSAAWTGPNGGSGSSSTECIDGYVDRCHRQWTYTDPAGDTWSGEGAVAAGAYRGAAWRGVTGPGGNTVVYGGAWRR